MCKGSYKETVKISENVFVCSYCGRKFYGKDFEIAPRHSPLEFRENEEMSYGGTD